MSMTKSTDKLGRAPALFTYAVAVTLLAFSLGMPLAGAHATVLACGAILLFGLPHGTFDLELIRRERSDGATGLAELTMLYLGCAALMLAVWQTHPVLALLAFLVISIVHFAEDWEETGSRFLSIGMAGAILAAPALLHREALIDIFMALSRSSRSEIVADLLMLAAPISLAVAFVGTVTLWKAGRRDLSSAAIGTYAAMILLPPAIGFALFFTLLHSPRHFAAGMRGLGWQYMRQCLPIVLPLTLAAATIGAGLYLLGSHIEFSDRILGATFMLLSILTVPHMIVPAIVRVKSRFRDLGQSARQSSIGRKLDPQS